MSFIYNMTDTWNNALTTYTAIKMNVTDTNSAADSLLMNILINSVSKFVIDKSGNVGIGTTNPDSKLHVHGAGADTYLEVSTTLTSKDAAHAFYDGTNICYSGLLGASGGGAGNWVVYNGGIRLAVGASSLVINEPGNDYDVRMEGDTDTNVFFLDASTDRIGIGTASPGAKLDVVGAIQTSTDFQFTLGGVHYLRSMTVNAPIAVQLWDGATDVEAIRFFQTGNVKIAGSAVRGTTEGTNHLDIFNGTSPVGTLTNGISLYSSSGDFFAMNAAGQANKLTGSVVFNEAGDDLDFRVESDNFTHAFFVDASTDFVGIRTSNVVGGLPLAPLHVQGNVWLEGNAAAANLQLRRYNGTVGSPTKVVSGNNISAIQVSGYQETTPAFNAYQAIIAQATEDWTSTANGFKWIFGTVPNTTATMVPRFVINHDGTVVYLPSTTTPATLSNNGEWTLTPTSDTNFRISYKGSDGTTRVGNITLA